MSSILKSSAKRRHVSMACISCRESKVKCDGGDPTCSNCANKNRECRYQAVDKRKLPLRVAIELLSNRVDQLCRYIREKGLELPPVDHEKNSALMKVLEMLGLAEVSSKLTAHSNYETEAATDAIKDTISTVSSSLPADVSPLAGNEPEENESQCSPVLLHESESVEAGEPRTLSSLPPPADKVRTVEVAEGHLDARRHRRGNALGGSDWDSDVGTFISTTDLNMQDFLDLASPRDTLCTTLEEMPEQVGLVFIDDDSPLVEESSDTEGIESLIDQLSDRVGTLQIGPGRETHFCGPTSTFNLVDLPLSDNFGAHRTLRNDIRKCLDRLETNPEVPTTLEDHLISLYFSWHDPFFHVVDRQMYEEAKAKWYSEMEDTPFYSEALRNAMCSLGAAFEPRYHPAFITFPKSLVDFFGDRAKALLEVELNHPCVATVQALVILSSQEIGNKRDSRGWLYSGMAIRLAFDLALHLDMSAYVSKGVVTPAEACLRQTVFWAAYTTDHLLGFYLGRPFRINMEDVTVGKPNGHTNQRGSSKWFPYILPDSVNASYGLLDCMEGVSQQHIVLCEIMAPCGYILYGTSSFSKSVLQELNAKIVAKLRSWKTKLPPILQVDLHDHTSPYLPHVLLLHMQYYQNLIYAHRPWMSKSYLQPNPPKGPGYLHARDVCIKSAIAIAKILDLYDVRYTLRRINVQAVSITSSAVLILLFAAVSQYPSREHDSIVAYLSRCFRALDELSLSWESAKRAKDLFMKLQRQWDARTRSIKSSRQSDGVLYRPMKRSRTSHGLDAMAPNDHKNLSGVRPESHGEINTDFDLDWMLMTDAQVLSENRGGDLYSFMS